MTKPQGIRQPCIYCGELLYSTNKYGVCVSNLKCKAINRFLSRHPEINAKDIPYIDDQCKSCGVKLTVLNWSIDRMIPAEGYSAGNIHWLCMRCNRLKGNASLSELQNIVAYMERELT